MLESHILWEDKGKWEFKFCLSVIQFYLQEPFAFTMKEWFSFRFSLPFFV